MNYINKFKELLNSRNISSINAFISEHPSVLDEVDERGLSGLMYIAYYQLPEVVKVAVEKKADFTIYEATAMGLLNQVKTKVETQPNLLNQAAGDGFYPLTLACYFGQGAIAEYLIKAGANVNLPAQNPTKVTPLHSAIARNDLKVCQLLVENGADINAQQMQGVTALHSAAHRGNLALVQFLVENGANTNAKTTEGKTALDFATQDGHHKVATFLTNY